MSPELEQRLSHAALAARSRAYAPYSQFLVGAAIQTKSGALLSGCNVENASYGLSMCAERVAVGTMIASGETEIVAVAVASCGGVTPCGGCRQVLAEFGLHFPVILIDSQSESVLSRWTMQDLLPAAFQLKPN